MDRDVIWVAVEQPETEHLRLTYRHDGVVADGLIIGLDDNTPFRLRYTVRCDEGWRVREVTIGMIDGERSLHLIGDGEGRWTDGAGNALPALDGCIDIDISATPFTNTLPMRRHTWQPGESAEFSMAYIGVPALTVQPDPQRYTCFYVSDQGGRFLYESLDRDFEALLVVDADRLVTDYPHLWRRAWER